MTSVRAPNPERANRPACHTSVPARPRRRAAGRSRRPGSGPAPRPRRTPRAGPAAGPHRSTTKQTARPAPAIRRRARDAALSVMGSAVPCSGGAGAAQRAPEGPDPVSRSPTCTPVLTCPRSAWILMAAEPRRESCGCRVADAAGVHPKSSVFYKHMAACLSSGDWARTGPAEPSSGPDQTTSSRWWPRPKPIWTGVRGQHGSLAAVIVLRSPPLIPQHDFPLIRKPNRSVVDRLKFAG